MNTTRLRSNGDPDVQVSRIRLFETRLRYAGRARRGFLPSEAEWEYAAAGGGGAKGQREYPWGSTAPGTDCAYLTTTSGRVTRGGFFAGTAASDLLPPSRNNNPTTSRSYGIGFRCARTPCA